MRLDSSCIEVTGWRTRVQYLVKLTLCFTKHHAMKAYWWSGSIAPHILRLRH